VINTETHRRKYENFRRDPTQRDLGDPPRRELISLRRGARRGRGDGVTGQEARDHIDDLSQECHDQPYNPDDIKGERVMLWVVPSRQTLVGKTADST